MLCESSEFSTAGEELQREVVWSHAPLPLAKDDDKREEEEEEEEEEVVEGEEEEEDGGRKVGGSTKLVVLKALVCGRVWAWGD